MMLMEILGEQYYYIEASDGRDTKLAEAKFQVKQINQETN